MLLTVDMLSLVKLYPRSVFIIKAKRVPPPAGGTTYIMLSSKLTGMESCQSTEYEAKSSAVTKLPASLRSSTSNFEIVPL